MQRNWWGEIRPINNSLSSRRISVTGHLSYALIASLLGGSLWLANWTIFNNWTMFFRLHKTQFWTTASLLCSTTGLCSSAFTKLRFQRLLSQIPLHQHVHIHIEHGSHYFNMGSSASFGNVSTVMWFGSHYSIMCSFIFHTCAGVLQSEMEASLTLILYDEKKACAHSHVTYGSHYSNMSSFIFRAYADVLVQPEM